MRFSRPILHLLALLLAAGLACNLGGGGEEPAAEPRPTQPESTAAAPAIEPSLAPTDTALPPTAAPTQGPTRAAVTGAAPTKAPAPTNAPAAAFELDTTLFSHPQGIFDLYPPLGWSVDSKDGGASFSAPDDSGYINVEVTNTGLVLDGDAFERFVDARDLNFFGQFEGYEVIDRQMEKSNGVARVTKQLLFDGIAQIVFTLYDQHDEAVFALDFWADEDVADAYGEKYEEIIDTATVYSETAAGEVERYYWIYTFTGPSDLFSIEVPIPWRYEVSEGDAAIVDTFYSPDEHGIIQNITYDDGTAISRSDAGARALELLKTYYATDIRITDDQVQSDGSERLRWNSPGGDYSGISFLETRGTTFLLFSVLWDNPYEDVYFDVLDYTISTYAVPE